MATLTERPPAAHRFRQHVGFDSLTAGEATKNNTSSYTLRSQHLGYQPSRRSRTFMVGVDEHAYSDYALVWLLTNMVDDGDEVVCVRVVESPPRGGEKSYQEDARKLMQSIQEKNELNKAISIILEYAVGKLHDTFQSLLVLHQPSMLVVGTKGRSLGGLQGLMNTRNSFSKYCLQYSPVPVVVVRPDDKRLKKKEKRIHDPSRQSYAAMLAHNGGKHEADSETSSLFELEKGLSPDEEAHKVAAAIGLPASFDPLIKPYTPTHPQRSMYTRTTIATRATSPPPGTAMANDSGDEESGDDDDDDDDYEIEAVPAQQLSRTDSKQKLLDIEQKRRLHVMEMGEAAVLKSYQGQDIGEEDDDDESRERKTSKT
ncbi:hypothetical protein QBC47DRAFT_72041 [Echria macrotheca]|uniref:UspA domain-containing protein n=1 Tax=Echria macrotheca TaxID=438768 RepID=A0AAJ0F7Z3_9PEZI|nr:hypothetical protein QBC47DRAFT_72041 [Echria macrotheca]